MLPATQERKAETLFEEALVPGSAVAWMRCGEPLAMRGIGETSADGEGIAVTPDTLFRIGSITKPLTAVAVLRLVDAGILDLGRPVH